MGEPLSSGGRMPGRQVTAGLSTKADQIRALAQAGYCVRKSLLNSAFVINTCGRFLNAQGSIWDGSSAPIAPIRAFDRLPRGGRSLKRLS